MRAMSLAADDGEGEQNEFRLLESQLEITRKTCLNSKSTVIRTERTGIQMCTEFSFNQLTHSLIR